MRRTRFGLYKFFLLLCLTAGTFGCATSYRKVLVSVIDSNTRQPVAKATVSASYPAKSSLFRLFNPSPRSVTDVRGEAMLKVVCERTFGPLFDVVVANEQYDQHLGYSESSNEWMNRPKEFIPT